MKKIKGEVKQLFVAPAENIKDFNYRMVLKINGVFAIGVLTNNKHLCKIGDNVEVTYTEKIVRGVKYRNTAENYLKVLVD